MRARSLLLFAVTTAALGALASYGCGGSSDGGAAGDDGGAMTFPSLDGSGSAPDCVNLCKQQALCIDGTTALTGVILDPAGKRPVPNAIVYVPNAAVPTFAAGASCDKCGTVTGSPLVATLTDANGSFALKDVPAGANIPLVVQIGRWRRQLVVPTVVACLQTALSTISLPRRSCEGDLPQLAVATGGDDAMECFLRKVGIDDREFTTDSGPGRVHLYAGSGASNAPTTAFDAAHGGAAFAPAEAMWSDPGKLARYDGLLLACEGELAVATKPPAALAAVKAFTAAGGRVLASHWQRYWFSTEARAGDPDAGADAGEPAGPAASPFPSFATWTDRADPAPGAPALVDTTPPRGATLRLWLGGPAVAGADANGQVAIASAHANVDAVDPTKALPWLSYAGAGGAGTTGGVAMLSANMPTGSAPGQQCGRIAYADFHAASGDTPGAPWPTECTTTDMTNEEKALEYALFDLASCITTDDANPTPPAVTTTPCTKCSLSDVGHAPPQTAVPKASCD